MDASRLDALVSEQKLLPSARAVLLLRVCLVAQALRPDVVERYWEDLKAIADQLPESSRESFEGLRDTLEPPPPAELSGFAGEIAEAVGAAKKVGSRDGTLAALHACEERITGRRWPSGKKASWDVLVRAWMDVDRAGGLMHLHRLPRAMQTNLLIRENDRSPLGPSEWAPVHTQVPKAARAAVEELLDRDEPHLDLPPDLAAEVSDDLLKTMFQGGADDREAEVKRDSARERHAKLVEAVAGPSPDVAGRLIERWLQATAETKFYAESWMARFFVLFRVIAQWSSHPELAPRLTAYASSMEPAYLRDAVLAHAAGLKPETGEQAEAAWAELEPQLSERGPGEHWFLVTLVRKGLPSEALDLARRSPRAAEIVPCVRRAWLYEHPDTAREAVQQADVTGDEIAEFLLRDPDGRVEYLRDRSHSGRSDLPDVMWKTPSVVDLIPELEGSGSGGDGAAVGSWYSKNEAKEKQFASFVHTNGYGKNLYENLDPILLRTLCDWGDAHPGEVDELMERMWRTMRDAIKPNIRFDLLRNDILERCEAVLGAHPPTVESFATWIRRELVAQAVRQQEGDTIYTFQLSPPAPFLYSLLAAQKVAPVSARRCDEILARAIAGGSASGELMTAAGQLYASDKGLAGLEPPAPIRDSSLLGPWQLGVVETALKDVLAALLSDGPVEEKQDGAEVRERLATSPPVCTSCGAALSGGESILGPHAIVMTDRPRPREEVEADFEMFHGSVCFACQGVFCVKCLGDSVDRCPRCGTEAKPAYRKTVEELAASM